MKRQNMITLWRVVFTYIVMMHHLFNAYSFFTCWYISVEFFFIVSGWLLAKDLYCKKQTPYKYTWNRLRRLYPEYLFSFILCIGFLVWYRGYGIKELIQWFVRIGFYEAIMGQYWLWSGAELANIATWYLSVLIVAGLLVYSMGKYFPEIAETIVFPVIIIIFVSFSYKNVGAVNGAIQVGTFGHMNFLRGLAELCIGYLLYKLNENTNVFKTLFLKIVGAMSLVLVIISSFKLGGYWDYLYIFLISIGVIAGFNTDLPFWNKIINFLDKISYSLYLNHIIFRTYIMPQLFYDLSWESIFVYVVVVTVFSIFAYYFVNLMIKCLKKIRCIYNVQMKGM